MWDPNYPVNSCFTQIFEWQMKTTLFVYNFSLTSHRIPLVFHFQRNPGEFQVFQVCGHPELQKSKITGFPTKFPPKTNNKPSSGYQHHRDSGARPTHGYLPGRRAPRWIWVEPVCRWAGQSAPWQRPQRCPPNQTSKTQTLEPTTHHHNAHIQQLGVSALRGIYKEKYVDRITTTTRQKCAEIWHRIAGNQLPHLVPQGSGHTDDAILLATRLQWCYLHCLRIKALSHHQDQNK